MLSFVDRKVVHESPEHRALNPSVVQYLEVLTVYYNLKQERIVSYIFVVCRNFI
jgi:hypothetical protein